MSVKVFCAGAVAALVGGVLLGGAMRPNPGATDDGRPAGPQMLANWSGAHSTGPFDPSSPSGGAFPKSDDAAPAAGD